MSDDHPSFLTTMQGSKGGRCRTRFRYLHRSNAAHKSSGGLAVGTLNVQGLHWARLSHRPNLAAVIHTARESHLDILCLSELHFTDLQLNVVYIEEFVLIVRGAVGLLLRKPYAMLWEQSGRKTFWEDSSGRLLAVAFCYQSRQLCFGSNYSPACPEVGPRREHMSTFLTLFRRLASLDFEQLWGGDWNGHISCEPATSKHFGARGLATPTTMGGRVVREGITGTPLMLLDSFAAIKYRGTWRHNQTNSWYELDYFIGTAAFSANDATNW